MKRLEIVSEWILDIDPTLPIVHLQSALDTFFRGTMLTPKERYFCKGVHCIFWGYDEKPILKDIVARNASYQHIIWISGLFLLYKEATPSCSYVLLLLLWIIILNSSSKHCFYAWKLEDNFLLNVLSLKIKLGNFKWL